MTVEDGKVVIHAVHEHNAKKFWEDLELRDVEPCLICGNEVTHKSFSAVGMREGRIVVCCEKGVCFSRFCERQRARSIKKVG